MPRCLPPHWFPPTAQRPPPPPSPHAGTWGKPPSANDSALNFAAAYRRRFRGRSALTCFVSGATLCDSVGAIDGPKALGGAALRRARYNLLHRVALFGLTERAEEGQLLMAWGLGWLDFYLEQARMHAHAGACALPRDERMRALLLHAPPAWRGTTRARKHAHTPTRTRPQTHTCAVPPCFSSRHQARYRDAHLVPGASHRRLALAELCRVPNLLRDMQRGERLDLSLYAFAQGVYHQRLREVPAEVLRHLPPSSPASSSSSPPPPSAVAEGAGGGAACSAAERVPVTGLLSAEDAALTPDD